MILPSALGGIVTSTVLAVARAAGETAPLILLSSVYDGTRVSLDPSEALPNIPVTIYTLSEEANPEGFTRAWGAGLVLLYADHVRQLRRPRAARPQPPEDDGMTSKIDPAGSRPGEVPIPPRVRIQTGPLTHAGPLSRQAPASRSSNRSSTRMTTSVFYGSKKALSGVNLRIPRSRITALIGPSGCGKSTFIRSLNRMNDSIPGFRLEGQILYHGQDMYAGNVDKVEVRRRIGMVFQKPNPFPKSIYDNVAWAPRNLGMKHDLDERVEKALRGAALWDEVKDRLGTAPSASPAASSSDSASRGRSRSNRTSCCSTSPPRRSTRSRPPRSRI